MNFATVETELLVRWLLRQRLRFGGQVISLAMMSHNTCQFLPVRLFWVRLRLNRFGTALSHLKDEQESKKTQWQLRHTKRTYCSLTQSVLRLWQFLAL